MSNGVIESATGLGLESERLASSSILRFAGEPWDYNAFFNMYTLPFGGGLDSGSDISAIFNSGYGLSGDALVIDFQGIQIESARNMRSARKNRVQFNTNVYKINETYTSAIDEFTIDALDKTLLVTSSYDFTLADAPIATRDVQIWQSSEHIFINKDEDIDLEGSYGILIQHSDFINTYDEFPIEFAQFFLANIARVWR